MIFINECFINKYIVDYIHHKLYMIIMSIIRQVLEKSKSKSSISEDERNQVNFIVKIKYRNQVNFYSKSSSRSPVRIYKCLLIDVICLGSAVLQ